MHKITACAALAIACLLSACSYQAVPVTADQKAAVQQEDIAKRAQDEVGIYQPTHFTRKRLANRIGQMLDDPNLATISYAQGLDGKLRCIGHTIGFPLPSATQSTSPQKWEPKPLFYSNGTTSDYVGREFGELVPQSEPDQLFSPTSADATWLLLVNDKTGQAAPAYFEGHVQTFLLSNKPDESLIAQDCVG